MRRSSLFWGIILIIVGALLLLNNLGILNINVWNVIWPLILIAFGISVLWGAISRGSRTEEQVSIPLEGASKGRIRIRHGAGRLRLTPGTDSVNLVEGTFGSDLDYQTRRRNEVLEVELKVPPIIIPFVWDINLDWDVSLNREIPLMLDLETGASESHLDLSDLNVTDLRLQSGASSTEVTFPAQAGQTHAKIETGAASAKLRIPEGVAARIRSRSGLASVQIDTGRFPRSGDVYQSADYATAANRLDLDIQTGVGSVEIS